MSLKAFALLVCERHGKGWFASHTGQYTYGRRISKLEMAAAKGFTPPNAGKGRVKGVPNKTTAALKDMILAALDRKGGVDYLEAQAEANPTAFLTLIGKVLPLQVTGDRDAPVVHVFKWQSEKS